MDEPTPGGVPTDPQPIGRYDWERLVLRAHLPKHIKAVALAMATFADSDGSKVRPGNRLLADALDESKTWVGQCVNRLEELGLLILVRKGGGKKRPGFEDVPLASVYQLSTPGEALEMRLDPDWKRYDHLPRPKGRTPTGRPSRRTTDPKPASTRRPVENPVTDDRCEAGLASKHRTELNPASPKSGDRDQANRRPRSSEPSTEIKPTWHYQGDQPQTRTTRVVALGGERHLTLVHSRATDEEFDHPVVVEAQPPEPAPTTRTPHAVPAVSDEQYAAARDELLKRDDFGQVPMALAADELAAEGWTSTPPYPVLVVRAAEIATRPPEPRSA